MSILIDENTKIIVQGITGRHGSFHTLRMLEYGTKIVAGVVPGKGGQYFNKIPIFDNVREALKNFYANWSIIFVPAPFAKNAALEALENNLNIVIITEGIPLHDTLEIVKFAKEKNLFVIGPNCPGIISVGKSKVGIIPNNIVKRGKIGIVSRSGTLTYEVTLSLTKRNIGQSTIVGIGGDKIVGTNFIEILKLFERDDETEKVVLIGEIGGIMEEKTAEFIIENNFSKEIIAYIAGKTAPKGKTMGHAGAIVEGSYGSYESKIKALKEANVKVVESPYEIWKYV